MTTELIDMEDLLKKVSRSFYLTLRILPHAIKPQLGLAYLLARATDTVADTGMIDLRHRQAVLAEFRKSIQAVCEGCAPSLPDFAVFIEVRKADVGEGTTAERTLLKNFAVLLEALKNFEEADRQQIRAVLEIITHGQEMDLMRFCASPKSLTALATDEELEAYTYEVAGCVGEFWTRICRAHIFPMAVLQEEQLFANAVRFGKGLQLVNILRDLPKDLREGRCYIPEQRLSQYGLKPVDLLDAGMMDPFRSLYDSYLQQADDYLRAGWRYTTSLPFGCFRVRLACAWPVLIGIQTLGRLRSSNVLDPAQRVKLTRAEIWHLILKSVILYPNRKAWNRLCDSIRTI